jgi:hypothetical protein
LADHDSAPILGAEVRDVVDDLREQFQLYALPVDDDILAAEVDATRYEDSIFVHQLKITGVSERRILSAVRDYYRAFEHRSRWLREDLLLVGELDRYERHLREEWQILFDRVADEVGESAAENAQRRAAQRVYAWVEDTYIPIRPRVHEPSLSRGSFHMLADQLKLGWHPDFLQRLKHLLEPERAP